MRVFFGLLAYKKTTTYTLCIADAKSELKINVKIYGRRIYASIIVNYGGVRRK